MVRMARTVLSKHKALTAASQELASTRQELQAMQLQVMRLEQEVLQLRYERRLGGAGGGSLDALQEVF